jgi:acyl-CoA thioesterase-1
VNRACVNPSLSAIGGLARAAVAGAFILSSCFIGCKSPSSNAGAPLSRASAAEPARAAIEAPADTTTDTRPILVCFGDSLTAGFGTDPGESYPDDLQRLLDAGGYHYHVVNAGISGNTTKDGLDRIGRVIARHPQLVVVEFGGNDGLRGLPLEQTEANLASMIDQLQKSGATVALAGISLPPDYGPDYIKTFEAMYPSLSKKFHVLLLPFLLKDVYGVSGDMQEDATHATAKGNKQVAINVEGLVQPLLKH